MFQEQGKHLDNLLTVIHYGGQHVLVDCYDRRGCSSAFALGNPQCGLGDCDDWRNHRVVISTLYPGSNWWIIGKTIAICTYIGVIIEWLPACRHANKRQGSGEGGYHRQPRTQTRRKEDDDY